MAEKEAVQIGSTDKGFSRVSFKDEATIVGPIEIPIGHVHSLQDDQTKRKLKPRHIQLIGIAGTIGTA